MHGYSKVYSYSLSGDGTYGILVPMIARGTITRFSVIQTSGTLGGFSYTLLNNTAALDAAYDLTQSPPPPILSPTNTLTPAAREESYWIIGPVTVDSTKRSYTDANETGWPNLGVLGLYVPYWNQSPGNDAVNSTVTGLPLKLVVVGGGNKTFDVAYTVCMWE